MRKYPVCGALIAAVSTLTLAGQALAVPADTGAGAGETAESDPASPAAAAAETGDKGASEEEGSSADERTANNAIYLELLGPGGIYSLNYDRAFGDAALRVGFSYISVSASASTSTGAGASANATFAAIPLTVSYLGLGSKTHMFEVGGGVTIYYIGAGADGFYGDDEAKADASIILPTATAVLGYRLQPKDGGFMFRAGISPLISAAGFLPWPHIGLGGTF